MTKKIFRSVPLAAAVVLVLRSRESEFTGNRVKNPDAYLLDIQRMNGTDNHALALKKGDVLVVLEAMKMENEIMAPHDAKVAQVLANKGATVNTGDVLVVLE